MCYDCSAHIYCVTSLSSLDRLSRGGVTSCGCYTTLLYSAHTFLSCPMNSGFSDSRVQLKYWIDAQHSAVADHAFNWLLCLVRITWHHPHSKAAIVSWQCRLPVQSYNTTGLIVAHCSWEFGLFHRVSDKYCFLINIWPMHEPKVSLQCPTVRSNTKNKAFAALKLLLFLNSWNIGKGVIHFAL